MNWKQYSHCDNWKKSNWKRQWSQQAAETTVLSWQSWFLEKGNSYLDCDNKVPTNLLILWEQFSKVEGQRKADGSKMTVFSLRCSGTQEPSEPTEGEKTGNVWIKSSNCISSLALFTRTNRATSPYWVKQWKKCHSVFFPPKSREPMPTSAGSQGLLKQGLKCPNNNYAVRGV